MIDAENAAQLWLESHDAAEWKQLLADCGERPALSEDVLRWLRATSPELRMQLDDMTARHGQATADALARFQQAFIGNVSEAAERLNQP